MTDRSVIIIGAGLAGLSAGCYAQMQVLLSPVGGNWTLRAYWEEDVIRQYRQLTTKLTCRYEAQRNSGRVQRFVRFCCYVPR
jgi:monoamine oxidase